MLTISAAGKSNSEALNIIRSELTEREDEIKILIDGPLQVEEIKNFLVSQNFKDIIIGDDDGILYLSASRYFDDNNDEEQPQTEPVENSSQEQKQQIPQEIKNIPAAPVIAPVVPVQPNTTGILIACESSRKKMFFLKKFLASLVKAKVKPNVLALINSAVSLAAYNSQTCDDLKKLEADGVQILISESCADKIGITEAAGVGVIVDMSEIIEEIFSCEKVISV